MRADFKSAKKDSQFKQLLGVLGSARVRAAHKYIGKIDSECRFHQHNL